PILMTTLAMVLGAVPLMFGASGAGAENQRQLGCVIIGGMSLGTVFTVFIVPIVYTLLTSKKLNKNRSIQDEENVKTH
ncbi:MAG: efflux RND transporter permease subunit, partial [Pseudomonadota bacterium]|nr:efflux RND transporter permease subunit [Pseudomonadota bacterium]